MAETACGGNSEGDVAKGCGGSSDGSFVWDDETQLYYHASSGFYHDPNAGWYYSSKDGLYYRYENGHYVLWESDEVRRNKEKENHRLATTVSDVRFQDQPGTTHYLVDDEVRNTPPPSEWLEETLINLYLMGYSTEESNVGCSTTLETDGEECNPSGRLLADELSSDSVYENRHSDKLDEGEEDRNTADVGEPAESSGRHFGEDEEKWLAQYGQVIKSEDKHLLPFPIVDFWDWRLVEEHGKKMKQVSRLVGRLVKRSMKLHPSMPAGGGILKSAPICEVYLDLVRVTTGKVYRLRSPNAEYLSSLLTYDSSNPTKDWDFPRLNTEALSSHVANVNDLAEASIPVMRCKGSFVSSRQSDPAFEKHNCPEYRDRAAARRALHGSFHIVPGEKNFPDFNIDNGDAFPESPYAAETTLKAIDIPFGAQSYGKRVMESMGWKEVGFRQTQDIFMQLTGCIFVMFLAQSSKLLFLWKHKVFRNDDALHVVHAIKSCSLLDAFSHYLAQKQLN